MAPASHRSSLWMQEEKESFDEYEGAAELTELLVRHANLPESEAEWVDEELLRRGDEALAWRFWKREERRKAKALWEFSSTDYRSDQGR